MKTKRMVQKICTMALALLMTAAVTVTPGPMQRTYADDGVAIDAAHFPDENFRKYISKHCDKNDDDILSPAEISSVTTLDPWSSSIQDFKGIEIFTNLTKFDCRWNPVISLDLSHNTALTSINCDGNELESLDVSKNTALTTLNCSSSTLTSLDLSQNTALTTLRCENSQLQSLDLTRNTALNTLYCGGNQITRLDLSHNPSLTFLDCRNNQLLTSLDLSNNTAISHLDCSNTSLTNLDLTNDTALVNLYCGDTQLTNLDLSRNTKLRHLNCSGSKLTSLDVSLNPALRELYCNNNTLTDLDLSSNTSLEALDCSGNKLTNLDLSENTNLFILDCSNNKLMSLDLSSNTFLHNSDDTYKTYFNSQSRSIGAAYSDGKLVVDLADDLGLDMSRVSDVVVTGGTYSDGKATFDIPVAADAMITYNYDTDNTNLSTKMDVTLRVTVCIVTFDTNGGSSVGLQTVKTGDRLTKPADPTKPGYTFGGWYTDEACTTAYDFSSPVTEDMTLYAKWKSAGTTIDPTEPGNDDPITPPSKDEDTAVTPENPQSGDLVTKKPILNIKARTAGSKTEKLVWTKVKDADGYDVYFAKCGSRLKKIRSTRSRTLKKAGLKKGLIYKYKVRAYKMNGGKKVYIASSYSSHAVAGGYSRKFTDAKKIIAAKKSLTLEAGKSGRISASQTKLKRGRRFLKTSHAALLRYRSTDKSVATVSRSGKVTAKKAGTCRIYIYAQNGMWAKVTVTVK